MDGELFLLRSNDHLDYFGAQEAEECTAHGQLECNDWRGERTDLRHRKACPGSPLHDVGFLVVRFIWVLSERSGYS